MFKKGHVQKANQVSRKNWWLRSLTPDKGSIREISMGEITDSIAPDDHLEGPYIFAENSIASGCSAPWAPGRGARCASAHGNFPPAPFLEILDPVTATLCLENWRKNFEVKKKKGQTPPPPPFISFLGDAPIKKKCSPPPPWSGSDWRHMPTGTPNLSQKNCQRRCAAGKKKVSEPPPPPAYQIFWELRDYGLAAVRKKHYVPPMIRFGFPPLATGTWLSRSSYGSSWELRGLSDWHR